MSLNIKDPETHQLAKQLAAATGESMAAAVKEAVRERLARIEGGAEVGTAERIHAIAVDIRSRLPTGWLDEPHGESLYDRDGLPR